MGKARKKTRRKGSKIVFRNKVGMVAITAVVLTLMIVLFVEGMKISKKLETNEERLTEINQEIENENQRTEDIKTLEEYMQSDEYIEKVAKDKLGLVKDNEIIFKEK